MFSTGVCVDFNLNSLAGIFPNRKAWSCKFGILFVQCVNSLPIIHLCFSMWNISLPYTKKDRYLPIQIVQCVYISNAMWVHNVYDGDIFGNRSKVCTKVTQHA